MLPRLQAEERLNAITDRAVAFGSADRDQRRRVVEQLQKDARVRPARLQRADAATLAGMGIGLASAPAASKEALSDG